jgi:hypothetical protein
VGAQGVVVRRGAIRARGSARGVKGGELGSAGGSRVCRAEGIGLRAHRV